MLTYFLIPTSKYRRPAFAQAGVQRLWRELPVAVTIGALGEGSVHILGIRKRGVAGS
jgi:hypothetical protein